MTTRWIPIGLIAFLLAACSTQTTVLRADFSKRAGIYVVGFAQNPAVRTAMENQLVNDLTSRDILAFASHSDIPDITLSSRSQLLSMANAKQAIGILVVNQAAADASDSVVQNPQRVSPKHADLRAFYDYTKANQAEPIQPDQRVFAEVNLFILDGDLANLFWSGTTWSFHADGEGTALRGISELIANQLQEVGRSARATAFDG